MTSRNVFDAFAVARGEGLHPRLRELFDRTAARPFSELAVRGDGMLQAGPDPASDALAAPSNGTMASADWRASCRSKMLPFPQARERRFEIDLDTSITERWHLVADRHPIISAHEGGEQALFKCRFGKPPS
jgi:hypothetical protein